MPTLNNLNPDATKLLRRLAALRATGRTPLSMSMSPESWADLNSHPAASDAGELKMFAGVPVQIFERCIGVGIVFDVDAI